MSNIPKATLFVLRIRKRLFRKIFAPELQELLETAIHLKKMKANNIRYRSMVKSIMNAATPDQLKMIKKRRGADYNMFIADTKREMGMPKLQELFTDDEYKKITE